MTELPIADSRGRAATALGPRLPGSRGLLHGLEQTREQLESLGGQHADLIRLVCDAIGWINQSVPTLLGDRQYALLDAKRVSEMVRRSASWPARSSTGDAGGRARDRPRTR